MKKILSQREIENLFKKPLIVYLEGFRKESKILNKILKRKFKSKTQVICRKYLKKFFCNKKICKEFSIIISLGGDGTFLRTAHFINNTPLLGINASKKEKEGFLTSTNLEDFEKKIKNKPKIYFEQLPRIKIIINNKEILDKGINDVFVGHKKSYKTAKYELIIRKKGIREKQLSSGIIISTAIGTNAWFKSAGGHAKKNTKLLYYIVREGYSGRIYKPKYLCGSLKEIEIRALKNLILVVDTLSEEYPLKKNDLVMLKLDKNKLNRVVFYN
ncbi:MAG: NAD(+)/NADH kinase [Candidatus Woesearchaeota archaeon]